MRPSRQQPYVPGLQILISSTLVSTITDDMIPFVRICRRDDGRWADTKGMPSYDFSSSNRAIRLDNTVEQHTEVSFSASWLVTMTLISTCANCKG